MSDTDDFRSRATEIFRQMRLQGSTDVAPDEPQDSPPTEHHLRPANEASVIQDEPPAPTPVPPYDREALLLTADHRQPEPARPTPDGGVTAAEVTELPSLGLISELEDVATSGTVAPSGTVTPSGTVAPSDTAAPSHTLVTGGAVANETPSPVRHRLANEPVRAGTPLASSTVTPLVIEGHQPSSDPADIHLSDDPASVTDLPSEASTFEGRIRHPGAERPLPRILAIANQKGGVGKTTTAVNLGAALAELHYRVLVIDLDPQGNASTGLGINGRNLDASVYDVILHDTPIEDVIEPTALRNLFVVPATIGLAGAEIELVPVFSREMRLRRALDSVRDDFDFVLIDCPPSLGLLTVNGLAAATEVVVPIQCEYYALEGLSQLLGNVNLVKRNLNNDLEMSTIILTMYDARTRLAEQVVEDVRSHFGAQVCRNVVPRTVRLSEAPSFGQPITVFDPSSRGAIAYRELAKEVSGGAPQRLR